MSFVTPALNQREGPTQISPLIESGYIYAYAHMGGYAGKRGSFARLLLSFCSGLLGGIAGRHGPHELHQ